MPPATPRSANGSAWCAGGSRAKFSKHEDLDVVEADISFDASCAEIVDKMPTTGTWNERLRGLLTAIVERGSSHPSVIALPIAKYAKLAPVMRIHDAIHEVLADAGFTPEQSVQIEALLFCYLVGHQTIEGIPDGLDWDGVPAGEFEHYRATRTAHADFDAKRHFQKGLDAIFAGFEHTQR